MMQVNFFCVVTAYWNTQYLNCNFFLCRAYEQAGMMLKVFSLLLFI